MEITQAFYAATRAEWRRWLRQHYRSEKEIWLIFYKQTTGKPRVEYNDAVEEALCFGWIDSMVKRIDEERFAQRFSPRRAGTAYSQANKERLARLIASGRVMKDVLATLADLDQIAVNDFKIPADILKAIKASRAAWTHFQAFSAEYQRIRIAFIDGARNRPKEFQKRLHYFIKMCEKNKQFGFGGIDKYY